MSLLENEGLKPMPERVSVLGKSDMMVLFRSNWDKETGITYAIRGITKEEEAVINYALNFEEKIDLPWAKDFDLNHNNIKLCGNFDINTAEDRDVIKKINFVGPDGIYMPSNFRYKDGCVDAYPKVGIKYTTTFRKMLYFSYCHTVIGRPNKIVIFSYSKKQYRKYIETKTQQMNEAVSENIKE